MPKSILIKITLSIFAFICLYGVYFIYKESRWRTYNDNTITLDVADNLDKTKINIGVESYMTEYMLVKNGQIDTLLQCPDWFLITYADSVYKKIQTGNCGGDYRHDFDYKFAFSTQNDTVFCLYTRNDGIKERIVLSPKYSR